MRTCRSNTPFNTLAQVRAEVETLESVPDFYFSRLPSETQERLSFLAGLVVLLLADCEADNHSLRASVKVAAVMLFCFFPIDLDPLDCEDFWLKLTQCFLRRGVDIQRVNYVAGTLEDWFTQFSRVGSRFNTLRRRKREELRTMRSLDSYDSSESVASYFARREKAILATVRNGHHSRGGQR